MSRFLVTTESGSCYEFDVQEHSSWMRRQASSSDPLRRDEEWVPMLTVPEFEVGFPMRLLLEPLGDGDVTVRFSTPVLKVEPLD